MIMNVLLLSFRDCCKSTDLQSGELLSKTAVLSCSRRSMFYKIQTNSLAYVQLAVELWTPSTHCHRER